MRIEETLQREEDRARNRENLQERKGSSFHNKTMKKGRSQEKKLDRLTLKKRMEERWEMQYWTTKYQNI